MDLNYLFHRQQVERARTAAAQDDKAKQAHEQLARSYEAQIDQATDGEFAFASVNRNVEAESGRTEAFEQSTE